MKRAKEYDPESSGATCVVMLLTNDSAKVQTKLVTQHLRL